MNITEISRDTVEIIASEAEKTLQKMAEDLGITFERGRGTFDPEGGTFTFKGEFGVQGSGQAKFARDVRLLGESWLTEDDYMRPFNSNGKTFQITGINLRALKYPINGQEIKTGKSYKFPTESVKWAIASERSSA